MKIQDKAARYAAKAHEGQLYNNGAFITHPIQVACILKCLHKKDDNLIAAAFLHDILEDTNIPYDELKREFNIDIARLVREVTKTRNNTFPNLKTKRGVLLKFADRLSNLSNMDKWSLEDQKAYIKKSKFWI